MVLITTPLNPSDEANEEEQERDWGDIVDIAMDGEVRKCGEE